MLDLSAQNIIVDSYTVLEGDEDCAVNNQKDAEVFVARV